MLDPKVHALVNYEDVYVQPLLLAALQNCLPDFFIILEDASSLPNASTRLLQWRQYEQIDFDRLMSSPTFSLANSYVIRKALIRKHYLSNTVSHWLAKNPHSPLKRHVQPSVEFEVDYAEFLDDALVEAYELRESWDRNASRDTEDPNREWWILKPGMSDRGQGIRLFSSEEELQSIFEEWDPPSDDDDEDGEEESDPNNDDHAADSGRQEEESHGNGIMTSHLRHFVAQPYIHAPLLMPQPHSSAGRKFHIRTYVLAVGALQVYVYKPMLALFAGHPYSAPSTSASPNDTLSSHLTNTCLQNGEREGSVHAFWSLPDRIPSIESAENWKDNVYDQLCIVTGQVFEAAARSMSIHFQPLPNAFEIFGLDFLVDAHGTAWLLEVNAFPDFAQTGSELDGLIQKLFEDTINIAVKPFFGLSNGQPGSDDMRQVLDLDLGRR